MHFEDFRIAATTSDLSEERGARDYAELIEFRMESAESPLSQLADYDGELPIIATNFSEESPEQRLEQLAQAAEYPDIDFVEIDIETAREYEEELKEIRNSGVSVIVSYINQSETPPIGTLSDLFEECASLGDVAKVVTFAEAREDALTLLRATDLVDTEGYDVISVALGEAGRHTRIAAPLYGSQIAYAPLDVSPEDEDAGQISLEKLHALIYDVEHGTDDTEVIDDLRDKFPAFAYEK